MIIWADRYPYIDTDELSDEQLQIEIVYYQALAVTDVLVKLMDELRRRKTM